MQRTKQEDGRVAALVFGTAFAAAVFAWWMSLAPRPLPADAPPGEFSAYRAIKHVEQMAVEPHPGGSHANEKVYAYITAQLQAMGAEMTVERPIIDRFAHYHTKLDVPQNVSLSRTASRTGGASSGSSSIRPAMRKKSGSASNPAPLSTVRGLSVST